MRLTWLRLLALACLLGAGEALLEAVPVVAQPAGGTVPPLYGIVLSACNQASMYVAGGYAPITILVTGQVCNSI